MSEVVEKGKAFRAWVNERLRKTGRADMSPIGQVWYCERDKDLLEVDGLDDDGRCPACGAKPVFIPADSEKRAI